jgi:hypothetical protein
LVAALLFLSACGVGENIDRTRVGRESIASSVRPLRGAEIRQDEIERVDSGSAARALLEFWRLAQLGQYELAAERVVPDLRQVYAARLASLAPIYRTGRPSLRQEVDDGQVRRVEYFVEGPNSAPFFAATGFLWTENKWVLVADSVIDAAR